MDFYWNREPATITPFQAQPSRCLARQRPEIDLKPTIGNKMPPTTIRGAQVLDGSVQRTDLDSTTVGQAVVRKIVQGSGVTLSSTGADSGTGDVTVSSPVSTDSGNMATLGSDSLVLVPQSQIWS